MHQAWFQKSMIYPRPIQIRQLAFFFWGIKVGILVSVSGCTLPSMLFLISITSSSTFHQLYLEHNDEGAA